MPGQQLICIKSLKSLAEIKFSYFLKKYCNMKNHVQLNPTIADFQKDRHYFVSAIFSVLFAFLSPSIRSISYNSYTFP